MARRAPMHTDLSAIRNKARSGANAHFRAVRALRPGLIVRLCRVRHDPTIIENNICNCSRRTHAREIVTALKFPSMNLVIEAPKGIRNCLGHVEEVCLKHL